MRFARPRRTGADITLTPLIDILFIVLLFLVLTATFTEQTVVRIALPETTTGDRYANNANTVRFLVEADGTVYLDGEPRTLADVARRLEAIPEKDSALVMVSADEQASHGRVIQLVDLVRQAGIFRLDIETFSASRDGSGPVQVR